MYKVVKRDGSVVDFNLHKISNAISQAFQSVEVNSDQDVINLFIFYLALEISSNL